MPQQPPADDFDLKQRLAEIKADGGLPDDQIAQMEAILGTDKAKAVLKRSVSNHKDWTRKTMEAAELRKQAEAERAAMEQEKAQLAQWRDGVQSQLDDAYKQYQESNISAATLKAKVQTIASRYGIDPKELMEGEVPADVQPTKGTPVASFDTSKFLTKDDLDKQFNGLKSMDALVQAQLYDIAAEHQDVFGKPLRGASELVKEALASGKPVRQLWEEKNNVQAKRDELREAQIRKDEREKADAEWRAKHSEQSVDGQRPYSPLNMPKSVAYETLMKTDAKPVKPNGSDKSMERVNRAVAAFEDVVSGKG
jgi:hypothetical protein